MDTFRFDNIEENATNLIEECSEVIQALCKIDRFGPGSEYQGVSNRDRLIAEIGDLLATIAIVCNDYNATEIELGRAKKNKLAKLEMFYGIQKK